MLDFYMVILWGTVISKTIENQSRAYPSVIIAKKASLQIKFLYSCLLTMLILFAGLRTRYNDTATYMGGFRHVRAGSIDWSNLSFSHYVLFDTYQKFIKTYISSDAQVFIFVSAFLTTALYVGYIAKHAKLFGASIYLFLIGPYVFSMAGIKQSFSVAFALYALDAFDERKRLKAALLFLIAYGFHPYVLCMAVVIFLRDRTWDKKILLIILGGILAIMSLESLLGFLAEIGKEYSIDEFKNYTINPFRVLIESLPVAISFAYKGQVNNSKDKVLITGVNMNIISFLFLSLGLFYNPMYMGRISLYFSAYPVLSTPLLLRTSFRDKRNGRVYTAFYYMLMTAYFILDLTKLDLTRLFVDQFRHISLLKFIEIFFS